MQAPCSLRYAWEALRQHRHISVIPTKSVVWTQCWVTTVCTTVWQWWTLIDKNPKRTITHAWIPAVLVLCCSLLKVSRMGTWREWLSFIDPKSYQNTSSTEVVICILLLTKRVRPWHMYVQTTYMSIIEIQCGTIISGKLQALLLNTDLRSVCPNFRAWSTSEVSYHWFCQWHCSAVVQ